jgi:hypothetical protein
MPDNGLMRFAAALMLVAGWPVSAQFLTHLSPETEQAFAQYTSAAEAAMDWTPRYSPKPGEVIIASVPKNGTVGMKDGLIHDWVAATIAPNTTVEKVLGVLQDYNDYKKTYAPDVTESRLLARTGNMFEVYLRLMRKSPLTAIFNTEYAVEYKPVGNGRWIKISHSTKVAEIDDEHERPVGTGNGYLWKLNAYWVIEQRPEGVYLECRSISLSRDIPAGLGWMIRPFVSGMPKGALRNTLEATVRGLR